MREVVGRFETVASLDVSAHYREDFAVSLERSICDDPNGITPQRSTPTSRSRP